jgi:hypothetical protein
MARRQTSGKSKLISTKGTPFCRFVYLPKTSLNAFILDVFNLKCCRHDQLNGIRPPFAWMTEKPQKFRVWITSSNSKGASATLARYAGNVPCITASDITSDNVDIGQY